MPAVSVVNRQTKKRGYGVPCGPVVLLDSNSAVSIRWEITFSISIVLLQSCPLSWMDFNTDCRNNGNVTRNAKKFWHQEASRNCAFGTISGGQTVKLCFWKSGMLCIGVLAA